MQWIETERDLLHSATPMWHHCQCTHSRSDTYVISYGWIEGRNQRPVLLSFLIVKLASAYIIGSLTVSVHQLNNCATNPTSFWHLLGSTTCHPSKANGTDIQWSEVTATTTSQTTNAKQFISYGDSAQTVSYSGVIAITISNSSTLIAHCRYCIFDQYALGTPIQMSWWKHWKVTGMEKYYEVCHCWF
jgi:hypothetical protein